MSTTKPTLEEKELESLLNQLSNLDFTINRLTKQKVQTLTKIHYLKQKLIKN
jgi:hypothetical protein